MNSLDIFNQIKDLNFSALVKKHYQKNDEFRQIIVQMNEEKFLFSQLINFKAVIKNYFNSYKLCEINKNNECQQEVKGFRFVLKFKDQRLFLLVTKCCHRKNSQDIKQNYLHSDFPQDLIDVDLKKQVKGLENKERNKLINYFANLHDLDNGNNKQWLFLNGDIGVGKTFLSVFYANSYIEKTDAKVIFINANNLFNFFRRFIFNKSPNYDIFYQKLKTVDLLVIDDFGNESRIVSFRDEFLLPLLQARYYKNLLTFFVSNFPYQNLKQFYTFGNDKIETIKSRTFFNLIEKKSIFLTLNEVFKK